mmetsp:Transcript_15832/g.14222  ORF Transcript_15832/g.14222 Transcript_15832/m.14222 type:complete len:216 (+) Transcript_15832:46-693(+)
MGLKEARQEPLCRKCTACWGCVMLIGIICIVIATTQTANLEAELDALIDNGIDCVIVSMNQGNQCDQVKDTCAEPRITTQCMDCYPNRADNNANSGGPTCARWNYKRWYYHDYQVAFSARDICTDEQLIENGYNNQSLITFDFTQNNECRFAYIYATGNHICHNVEEKCGDTTFELDTPLLDGHQILQDTIIAGAVLILISGCCCLGWIGWAGWF